MQLVTASEALAHVRPGQRVYLHGGAATPLALVEALAARAPALHDVELVHLHTEAPAPYVAPEFAGHIRHNALFIGPNTRAAVAAGDADYTPVFLSEIPSLFEPGGALPLDVALIQVSPPDATGHCSLGVSVDVALSALRHAKTVIAQVNPEMPWTHGPPIRVEDIDFAVEAARPLPEHHSPPLTDEMRAIGRAVAALVPDGATLQLGIGGIPNAVLAELGGHRDLGVHTEMFSDGLLPLIESGVVNGSRKSLHRGKVASAFVIGSRDLYRFIDHYPDLEMMPVEYTNNVEVIALHARMVAVNAALSVDLTGQVAADSLGTRLYSGIGGQVDFIRGAARSRGGVPVIALPSTAAGGTISRICAMLEPGTGVVTTRGDVHWVVTEHGAANLHGRTIRERARMLIDLAHPDFRAGLEAEAGRLGYLGRRAG
ncbi:MAG: acetyl-CoA hydrolase/transferase family protein [Dehalococcoidia bacterium]